MENLVQKLERLLDQKLEVIYGDKIVLQSSDSNPPEMEETYMEFDKEEDFVQWANFLIQISKL